MRRDPPTDSDSLVRARLVNLVRSSGHRICVLSASSGWGKTTLAAQVARDFGDTIYWFELAGESLSPAPILDAVSLTTDADEVISPRLPKARTLLVLDDVRLDLDDFKKVLQLQREVGSAWHEVRIVITTRNHLSRDAKRYAALLDSKDLAISVEDIRGLPLLQGEEPKHLERWRQESGGNFGLFTALRQSFWAENSGRTVDWFEEALSRLDEEQLRVVTYAAFEMTAPEQCSESALQDLRLVVPVINCYGRLAGDSVSTCLRDAVMRILRGRVSLDGQSLIREVVRHKIGIGDYTAAYEAAVALRNHQLFCEILGEHQDGFLAQLPPGRLRPDIESVPLHVTMEHPALVVLWARVLYALNLDSDAANKARAALKLAHTSGDSEMHVKARNVLVDALCRMQHYSEAVELMRDVKACGSAEGRLAEQVLAATVELYVGDISQSVQRLNETALLATEVAHDCHDLVRFKLADAVARTLLDGDYARLAVRIALLIPAAAALVPERDVIRGNLGFAFLELGRLVRSKAILAAVLSSDQRGLTAVFGAAYGCYLAAQGDVQEGLSALCSTCESGAKLGWDADMAVNRLYYSAVLRAAGHLDDALTQAERAYERLCVINYMGYRPLAALEVAASLLSLGDVVAARRWVANVESEDGFGVNRYHALRAAMILAECDRIEGDVSRGVSRLEAHAEHILSESSNWQMAMYCRAFPGLLGMFAAAVGAERIPVHMLRMVLPEFAERGMRVSRDWLQQGEWELLGRRCLGDTGFSMLERRQGEPICHVRLFGGLDVVVGDRVVTSRDWKKSKARLMFAMLVARRGREVAREQVLEHLWPELSEERARNNYYVAWSAMKLALMGQTSRSTKCPYVDNRGGRLRIVADVLRSDVDEFEEALEQARDADAAGDSDTALSAYVRLSTVYRGELLPGDVYDDWFAPLRDHYQREFIDAMMRAAELLLERDDPCEALVYARRALSADPLREDAYQVALRCHIAAGQRSGAIETFLQCRDRLSEDLGLDPSAETMALYQEILVMEDCPRYDDYGLS